MEEAALAAELAQAIGELGKDILIDTAVDQLTGRAIGTAVGAVGGAVAGSGLLSIPAAAAGAGAVGNIGQAAGVAVGTIRLLKNGKKIKGYVEKGKKIYKISNKLVKNNQLMKKAEEMDSFAKRGYQFVKMGKGVEVDAKIVNKVPTKELLNNIQKQTKKYADDVCDWVKEVWESGMRGNSEILKNGGRTDGLGLSPLGENLKKLGKVLDIE